MVQNDPDSTSTQEARRSVPLLSTARFGPGMIVILCFLVFLGISLALAKLGYLAVVLLGTAVLLLSIKSVEELQAADPIERKLVGQKCLVMTKISKGQRGIVRIYNDENGELEHELWSAEVMSNDFTRQIDENSLARVVGMRGIILKVNCVEP